MWLSPLIAKSCHSCLYAICKHNVRRWCCNECLQNYMEFTERILKHDNTFRRFPLYERKFPGKYFLNEIFHTRLTRNHFVKKYTLLCCPRFQSTYGTLKHSKSYLKDSYYSTVSGFWESYHWIWIGRPCVRVWIFIIRKFWLVLWAAHFTTDIGLYIQVKQIRAIFNFQKKMPSL